MENTEGLLPNSGMRKMSKFCVGKILIVCTIKILTDSEYYELVQYVLYSIL